MTQAMCANCRRLAAKATNATNAPEHLMEIRSSGPPPLGVHWECTDQACRTVWTRDPAQVWMRWDSR